MADARGTSTAAPAKHAPNERQQQQARGVQQGTKKTNEAEKRVPKATQQEMEAARLDLGYRDHCAHLLIPLNECRQQTSYMPWSCQDLRHAYEKCQYDEYLLRVKQLREQRKI